MGLPCSARNTLMTTLESDTTPEEFDRSTNLLKARRFLPQYTVTSTFDILFLRRLQVYSHLLFVVI